MGTDGRGSNRRVASPPPSMLSLLLLLVAAAARIASGDPSVAGTAGHALLFSNNYAVKRNFDDFPTSALTFEAWVQTSDFCHIGTFMSYSVPSNDPDPSVRDRAFNSFVIFDPIDIVGCRDFEFLQLVPDEYVGEPDYYRGCTTFFDQRHADVRQDVSVVSRTDRWHHIAITWDAAANGTVSVYKDGLRMVTTETARTQPLQPGGTMILGAEQDCYGGCTESQQSFFGMMDDVRIWNVARSEEDIVRDFHGFFGDRGRDLLRQDSLVAYWRFNDPDDDVKWSTHDIAKDSSTRGNDLTLVSRPHHAIGKLDVTDEIHPERSITANALRFDNNYALSPMVRHFPTKDFSVEFWAKLAAHTSKEDQDEVVFFSYADTLQGDGDVENDEGLPDSVMLDDAILISRYLYNYKGMAVMNSSEDSKDADLDAVPVNSTGAVSVQVNTNREGTNGYFENWVDFDCQWTDSAWHHIAVTWNQETGVVQLYMDGEEKMPFWKADNGRYSVWPSASAPDQSASEFASIAAGQVRAGTGAVALGQDQECIGGCFKEDVSLHGFLGNVRVWSRVLSKLDVKLQMYTPASLKDADNKFTERGLIASYPLDLPPENQEPDNYFDTKEMIVDVSGEFNDMILGGNAPVWQLSYAPLIEEIDIGDEIKVSHTDPTPGAAGASLLLNDAQVVVNENFQGFPSTAITVEFWMWSVDKCREGVPFSYATGDYNENDNSFLIFNYNDWGVSVMEDEGTISDHTSGISSTDGKWHHIAVSWESATGKVILYDNGRPVWSVLRAKGQSIPSGGTLVVGREQDCRGGCFDSAPGAAGSVDSIGDIQYGIQDFYGAIEEMRVWSYARTQEDIVWSMRQDDGLAPHGSPYGTFDNPGIDPFTEGLVAYWKFDEGEGYFVEDSTGLGNELIMSTEPSWMVVEWLSVCGNGIVEGNEECDDGNMIRGDGCDLECRVETGFICSKANPSVCSQSSPPMKKESPPPPPPVPDLPRPPIDPTPVDPVDPVEPEPAPRPSPATPSSPTVDPPPVQPDPTPTPSSPAMNGNENAPTDVVIDPSFVTKKRSSSAGKVVLIILIVVLLGVCAGGYFLLKKRKGGTGNGTNAFYKRLGRQSRVGLDMQGHELGGILEDDEPLDLAGGTGYVPPNYDDM